MRQYKVKPHSGDGGIKNSKGEIRMGSKFDFENMEFKKFLEDLFKQEHAIKNNFNKNENANIYENILMDFLNAIDREQTVLIHVIKDLQKTVKEYQNYLPLVLQMNLNRTIDTANLLYMSNNEKLAMLLKIIGKYNL